MQSLPSRLLSALPSHVATIYKQPAGLFHDNAAEIFKARNRRFSSVLGSKEEYLKYFRREDIRDLWELGPVEAAVGRCSMATVPKRDSDLLRKIFQVCPMNECMVDVETAMSQPVDYGLLGAGVLTQMTVPDDVIHVASLDQSNAFTYIIVPLWWWPYQAAPCILASDLPPAWRAGRWKDSQRIARNTDGYRWATRMQYLS